MSYHDYKDSTTAGSVVSHIATNTPCYPPYSSTSTGSYTTSTLTTSNPSYTIEAPVDITFVFEERDSTFSKRVLWPCVPSLGDVVRISGIPIPPGEEAPAYYVASLEWHIDSTAIYKNSCPHIEIKLKSLHGVSSSAHSKLRKELIIKRVLEALL